MAADKSLINELLDALEEMLIENGAYRSTIAVLGKRLPLQYQQLADEMIATAKADPELRKMIRAQFASFRDQSPEQALEGLAKIVRSKRDVN